MSLRYGDDGPGSLREWAEEFRFTFPLCFDESQSVANAYTPLRARRSVCLRRETTAGLPRTVGRQPSGNGKPVTRRDIRAALDATLAGLPVESRSRPSAGCNIKWKPGNAPAYFGVRA